MVSARTARRGVGKCRTCLYPPRVPPVDDTARRFWLKRFSDVELASLASGCFGRVVSPAVIHSRRIVLLGSASQESEEGV